MADSAAAEPTAESAAELPRTIPVRPTAALVASCLSATRSPTAAAAKTRFRRAPAIATSDFIYRSSDKKLTFVGSHQSGPNQVDGVNFPKSQEGHSAYTIAPGGGRSGLQTNIVTWLKAAPPDIVTLMIGTNDVGIQFDLQNAPQRLGVLVDTIIATSPRC